VGYLDAVALRGHDDRLAAPRRRDFRAVEAKAPRRRSFSSRGMRITQAMGLGAAWPSPQIDASAIARDNSSSSGRSHASCSSSPTAFSVPTRQGVHWPQDSAAKKRIRLSAASRARSCCESTMTPAEPMKQPCGCSVSKSSGMSASDAGRIPPEAPPGR
jgi:hypothetical protein